MAINSLAIQIGIPSIVGYLLYSVTKICDNFSSLTFATVAFIFQCAFVSKIIIVKCHRLDQLMTFHSNKCFTNEKVVKLPKK